MTSTALPQSDDGPYVRVGIDDRGSACWEVVTRDLCIRLACGHRALELCRDMRRQMGLTAP